MKIIDVIKNNKMLFFLSLVVFVLLSLLLIAIFNSPSKQENSSEIIPTPTRVLQQIPTPTSDPLLHEEQPSDTPLWTREMPLKDITYYIDYDPDTYTIIARVYPTFSFTVPKEDQVAYIKTQVEKALVEIGVDLSREQIEWIIEE